jgi:MFS family permease
MFRKIYLRVVPLTSVAFLVAQIDKMNIGFAKLTMFADLNFSDTTYGLGATLFLIGYALFGVPSNAALRRVGARRWLGILMVLWSIASAATLAVRTPSQFYTVRFLLGVAEAGFYPGVIFYFGNWFTKQYRTKAVAMFMTAAAVAGIIAGPLSGALLRFADSVSGLSGWQWLFLIEALPALLLGAACWIALPERPETAHWLSETEKAELACLMAQEFVVTTRIDISVLFKKSRIWLLGAIFGCYNILFFAVLFWLPTLIKASGAREVMTIGSLSAIPWTLAAVTTLMVAAYVDRRQNSHVVLIMLSSGSACAWFLASAAAGNIAMSLLAMSLAVACAISTAPVFWNLPTAAYKGPVGASAVAFVMMQSQCYTLGSPYLIALIKEATGNMNSVMYFVAGISIFSAMLVAVDRWLVSRDTLIKEMNPSTAQHESIH